MSRKQRIYDDTFNNGGTGDISLGLGAMYDATQITQSLSGIAIPSSAFNAAVTLSSFAAAIVHGSIR
jgi:hypothetical protein